MEAFMGKTLLLTDWLVIATAGPTVDGREIKESWLTDIAETYDREEYPAFLNVEHWGGNLGMVWEVRTRKDAKGRTALEAKIRPNKYYLQQNAEDHRLCFSIEVVENFAGTGRAYLTGLATTDQPASLGTTAARFSCRGDAVKLDLTPSATVQENGIVCAVKTALADFFKPQNKEKEMEKTEMAELLASALNPLQASLAELKNSVEKMSAKPADHPENKAAADSGMDKLTSALEVMTASLKDLEGKFAELEKSTPKAPPATGPADSENLI